jgi:hypothetical protein
MDPNRLKELLRREAWEFCDGKKAGEFAADSKLEDVTQKSLDRVWNQTLADMELQLSAMCKETNGIWINHHGNLGCGKDIEIEPTFVTKVYGGISKLKETMSNATIKNVLKMGSLDTDTTTKDILGQECETSQEGIGWGLCLLNSEEAICHIQDAATGDKGYAKWDGMTCFFTSEFTKARCESISGKYLDASNECWVFE